MPYNTSVDYLEKQLQSQADAVNHQRCAGMAAQAVPSSPEDRLDLAFTYHSPSPEQLVRLTEVREAAKAFAHLLYRLVPSGSDRSAAVRKLREAVMTANAAIVLGGLNLQ